MKYIIYTLLPVFCLLTACNSSDDNWEPGPEPDADSVVAYFSRSNEVSFIITPDQFATDPTVQLTVERLKTDAAASVPIVVVSNEGKAVIPATVEFSAGEAQAILSIDISSYETFKNNTIKLRIGDDCSNPYAVTDGIDTYTGSILVSDWVKVVSSAEFAFETYYPTVRSDIYHLEGINLFRIEHFLGSPYDLQFSIDCSNFDNDDQSTWVGELYPKSNAYWDEWGYWWLMDDTGDDYAAWTIGGLPVAYAEFYYGTGYSPISFVSKTLRLTPYIYQDDSSGNWYGVKAIWE